MEKSLDLEDLKRRIKEAEDDDYTATSTELLRLYIEREPSNYYYRYRYADNLRILGRVAESEQAFHDIPQHLIPADRRYLFQLSIAQLYESLGDAARAEAHLRAATKAAPNSTIPFVYLGAYLAGRGRIDEAIEVLVQGLSASGDLDEVYFNLGNCHRARGDYDVALKSYTEAIRLSPTYHEAVAAARDVEFAIAIRGLKCSGDHDSG